MIEIFEYTRIYSNIFEYSNLFEYVLCNTNIFIFVFGWKYPEWIYSYLYWVSDPVFLIVNYDKYKFLVLVSSPKVSHVPLKLELGIPQTQLVLKYCGKNRSLWHAVEGVAILSNYTRRGEIWLQQKIILAWYLSTNIQDYDNNKGTWNGLIRNINTMTQLDTM